MNAATSGMAMPADQPAGGVAGHGPIRRMTGQDLREALARGFDDWKHCRSDALTLAIIFPIAGFLIAAVFVAQSILPFIFPICSGVALLGPISTLWFAGLSRTREQAGRAAPEEAFNTRQLQAIQRLSSIMVLLFVAWVIAAAIIYGLTLGSLPGSSAGFVQQAFTTPAGWAMILIGCAVGALFALVALGLGFMSFPAVLDRPISAMQAIKLSVRACLANKLFVLGWGVLVVAGLVLGALPALFGLVLTVPVLGHATWHLYRRMIG